MHLYLEHIVTESMAVKVYILKRHKKQAAAERQFKMSDFSTTFQISILKFYRYVTQR